MSALSDHLEEALLNHVYRGDPYTAPGTVYVALFTSPTTDAGGGDEVDTSDWTNYERIAVTTGGWTAPAAEDGAHEITNSSTVDFGTATVSGAPVEVTHVAIVDADTGGNFLHHGALAEPKTVANEDPVRFGAGTLALRLA